MSYKVCQAAWQSAKPTSPIKESLVRGTRRARGGPGSGKLCARERGRFRGSQGGFCTLSGGGWHAAKNKNLRLQNTRGPRSWTGGSPHVWICHFQHAKRDGSCSPRAIANRTAGTKGDAEGWSLSCKGARAKSTKPWTGSLSAQSPRRPKYSSMASTMRLAGPYMAQIASRRFKTYAVLRSDLPPFKAPRKGVPIHIPLRQRRLSP